MPGTFPDIEKIDKTKSGKNQLKIVEVASIHKHVPPILSQPPPYLYYILTPDSSVLIAWSL